MTVVRPSSIPFGWKVIPETAETASVTLRVNLKRLNIHFTSGAFVMNVELWGKWKSQHLCLLNSPFSFSLSHTQMHYELGYTHPLKATEQIPEVVL